jgi:hypothetical protein
MFTPTKIERGDCYAEYMARQARARRLERFIAAGLSVACGSVIVALAVWGLR